VQAETFVIFLGTVI